jgi:glycosyltransferase involved in cell wall biosynthesis
MNIGFISTRLAGTDGVSLETAKLATIVRRLGHQAFYCAGELDPDAPPGLLVPEMHFSHSKARRIHDEAFVGPASSDLRSHIEAMAAQLYTAIGRFVDQYDIDVLVPQNALAIPMHIPLGLALADYIAETGMPTLAHHHDFYWERDRFARCAVPDVLERAFPPKLPSMQHMVINTLARDELLLRTGIVAHWLPNIFDFATPPPRPDEFVADLPRAMGFLPGDRVILQPTRVVPRKGIELAIELVRRLGNPRLRLLITHHAGDEGLEYLHQLKWQAEQAMVDLRYMAHRFAPARQIGPNGSKTYSLWDAYPLADLVTYPSFVEGFGNAFLEAVYFRRPLLVNRYPVYVADLAPLGFRCIEIDGAITDIAVKEVRRLLANADLAREIADHNAGLAMEHFSYEAVTPLIAGLLQEIVS